MIDLFEHEIIFTPTGKFNKSVPSLFIQPDFVYSTNTSRAITQRWCRFESSIENYHRKRKKFSFSTVVLVYARKSRASTCENSDRKTYCARSTLGRYVSIHESTGLQVLVERYSRVYDDSYKFFPSYSFEVVKKGHLIAYDNVLKITVSRLHKVNRETMRNIEAYGYT